MFYRLAAAGVKVTVKLALVFPSALDDVTSLDRESRQRIIINIAALTRTTLRVNVTGFLD